MKAPSLYFQAILVKPVKEAHAQKDALLQALLVPLAKLLGRGQHLNLAVWGRAEPPLIFEGSAWVRLG